MAGNNYEKINTKMKWVQSKKIDPTLTLNHHLVTGNQYLLAIAGLCVLEDGGSRLGSCCSVGHGQRLKALDSICTVISQLNGPTLCDCDCMFGEGDR